MTIEIKDPKYSAGDILELPNENNDKSLIVKITGCHITGTWEYKTKHGEPFVDMTINTDNSNTGWQDAFYNCVVVSGCHDNVAATPWTGNRTLPIRMSEIDSKGELLGKGNIPMIDWYNVAGVNHVLRENGDSLCGEIKAASLLPFCIASVCEQCADLIEQEWLEDAWENSQR